ncbi:P-loop containing nucleoside triphosphate hydrolase protein, partial [Plectosphaerella cucumerina]
WTTAPNLPTTDEVLHQTLARPLQNLVDSKYLDKDRYLEVQYRLLRYEGVEPLLRAVDKFRANPLMREDPETCIYDKVCCVSLNIIRLGPLARLRFCNLRSDRLIDWGQTQRLTPGSCVAISTAADAFRTRCWIAFVSGKDDKNMDELDTPVIDVELEDAGSLADFVDPRQEFVMIEARSNYYEAVRHVLAGLQQATTETSPLMKYFTGMDREVGLPRSIPGPDSLLDISAAAPIALKPGTLQLPARGEIPPPLQTATGLDGSQLAALQRMLATDLAIVQGPPGTGKTHTSMAALRVLLADPAADGAPIVVTAQKNDTVDELLGRLLAGGVRCARLGGQSKNDDVDRCTLVKLREQTRSAKSQELETLLNFQRARAKFIVNRCLPSRRVLFLDPKHLEECGILTARQCQSLGGVTRPAGKDPRKKNQQQRIPPIEEHPFARWLGGRFSVRPEPQAFQMARVPGDDGLDDALHCHLAEADNSHKRKDTISSQVINFGAWCDVGIDDVTIGGRRPLESEQERNLAAEALLRHEDLWQAPAQTRPLVYRLLEERMLRCSQDALRALLSEISMLTHALKAERWVEDFVAIRASRARVIGCTTTGLTKYRALLAALAPRIVVVEEAAESREANISAALLPAVERLVLIGDHLQLSPHADVMELARPPYNLHISAFERFILRGVAYTTLSDQRRMASEIRAVLNRWYPTLRDHARVRDLPRVPGMGAARALWLDHSQPENGNRYSSKFNAFEARLVTGLARYLVAGGVDPARITVLAFYSGQKTYVYNIMQQVPELATLRDVEDGFVTRQGVEVQTVDGYQGKENDVVLLSVVRSPDRHDAPSIGFLDRLNRAIVALSRARLLNVVVGNMANLRRCNDARDIWDPVAEAMQVVKAGAVPLVCAAHGKAFFVAASAEIWRSPTKIGCGAVCGTVLACGHTCHGRCHPQATAHACACGRTKATLAQAVGVRAVEIDRRDLNAHMDFVVACEVQKESLI